MLVKAYAERAADGWYVVEEYGWDAPERTGPYQWRWWARLLAWLADDTRNVSTTLIHPGLEFRLC